MFRSVHHIISCVSTCESRNCSLEIRNWSFFFWETVNYETVNLWPSLPGENRGRQPFSMSKNPRSRRPKVIQSQIKVTPCIQTSLCVICLSEIHRWQRTSRVGSLQNKTRDWDKPRISNPLSLDNFDVIQGTPASLIPSRSQSLIRSLSRTTV